MDVLMGGRVAEEIIFGANHVTTGASSDLQQATNYARAMITQWGMSSKCGPMYHTERELEKLSPATREAIESEVKELLVAAEGNAKRILSQHKEELHKLAQGLLHHETLSRAEINDLLTGGEAKLAKTKAKGKLKVEAKVGEVKAG